MAVKRSTTRGAKRAEESTSRERILATAARLFARKGYAATSMDEVAAAARTSKSSIYWHFENKEDILLELISQSTSTWIEEGLETVRSVGRPSEKLDAMLTNTDQHLRQSEETLRLLLGMACERGEDHPKTRRAIQQVYRNYREAIAKELAAIFPFLPADVQEAVSTLLLACFDGLFVQWQLDPGSVDPEKIFATVRGLLRPVLRLADRPPPGGRFPGAG